MEAYEVSESCPSLSRKTRLNFFKILIRHEKDGRPPWRIAEKLKIPDNTLSIHLSHMSKVGLITFKKNRRSLTYVANKSLVKNLIDYLQKNCCEKERRSKVRKC